MKRYGNLMEKVTSYENLLSAFYDAARGKYHGFPVFEFKKELHTNLTELKDRLQSGTYEPRGYRKFEVF